MLHCHARVGSDRARFLRGFALAGKRRRNPRALSIPSAACLPSHAGYQVRVAIKGHGYAGVSKKVLDEFRVNRFGQICG
jgi:hypothetical protein